MRQRQRSVETGLVKWILESYALAHRILSSLAGRERASVWPRGIIEQIVLIQALSRLSDTQECRGRTRRFLESSAWESTRCLRAGEAEDRADGHTAGPIRCSKPPVNRRGKSPPRHQSPLLPRQSKRRFIARTKGRSMSTILILSISGCGQCTSASYR